MENLAITVSRIYGGRKPEKTSLIQEGRDGSQHKPGRKGFLLLRQKPEELQGKINWGRAYRVAQQSDRDS